MNHLSQCLHLFHARNSILIAQRLFITIVSFILNTTDLRNASVYIGSDTSAVQRNRLIAVSARCWQTRALKCLPALCRPAWPRSTWLPTCPPSVQSGLNLTANSTVALPAGGVPGRYAIVYTGMADEGQMSVADLQVYTAGEARVGRAGRMAACHCWAAARLHSPRQQPFRECCPCLA